MPLRLLRSYWECKASPKYWSILQRRFFRMNQNLWDTNSWRFGPKKSGSVEDEEFAVLTQPDSTRLIFAFLDYLVHLGSFRSVFLSIGTSLFRSQSLTQKWRLCVSASWPASFSIKTVKPMASSGYCPLFSSCNRRWERIDTGSRKITKICGVPWIFTHLHVWICVDGGVATLVPVRLCNLDHLGSSWTLQLFHLNFQALFLRRLTLCALGVREDLARSCNIDVGSLVKQHSSSTISTIVQPFMQNCLSNIFATETM